jgi:exosome complex protein LRP1
MTSKMLARAEYEKELKEAPSDEDETLQVFDEMETDQVPQNTDTKGKGKALESLDEAGSSTSKKRRRPAVDPFAGMHPLH